ncbi:S-adenosyl-L-methionine-dependent methyltransferase [Salix suchowensis]|nr:S-adenosyl-L-methionine-dependent methyltransferase [Salix suchowensis]
MWHRARLISTRQLCTATRRRINDEGDWFYSSEWWGTGTDGHTVFRSTSDKGNGIVSVLAYPSSRPSEVEWGETEKWLERRYAEEIHKITLKENNGCLPSTTITTFSAGSIFLMQQPHCLAVPYLKSMVSAGLATIAYCNNDLVDAIYGKKTIRILCIGHGGGSLPLFLATKIQGAVVDIVEIDPLVISASIRAMVLWKGIHERLCLYEADAENFVLNTSNTYDMIFIDAYDGDDIFPRQLWDPDSPFLKALSNRLHSGHGTVVVNLHSDSEVLSADPSVSHYYQQLLPMGKHVSKVCRAYKSVLAGNGKEGSGLGFTVAVPWVCNTSLVVCRGSGMNSGHSSRDSIMNDIASKSCEVENVLNLPFSFSQYIKSGFTLVD